MWSLYDDRIVLEKRKRDTRRQYTLVGRIFLCDADADEWFNPDEDSIVPITDHQLQTHSGENYAPLMALRKEYSNGGWASDRLHIAHNNFVTCVSLLECRYDGTDYQPEFVFENGEPITRIGFTDPSDPSAGIQSEVSDSTPLCVSSLSAIRHIDARGNKA